MKTLSILKLSLSAMFIASFVFLGFLSDSSPDKQAASATKNAVADEIDSIQNQESID